MTELPDEQEEEKEVLISIYGSDSNFKKTGPCTFQYKVGDADLKKSFLIEVTWPEKYPEELPVINLDTFYNSHLSQSTKRSLNATLISEIEALLGCPMTYTLFEYCRDNVDSLIPDSEKLQEEDEKGTKEEANSLEVISGSKKKKEVLSKSAKRRQADRLNTQGELPRGWDWVDIIKHLSKTGSGPAS